jgi:5-methylcytosine-specific restriction enzyme subunit McrC
MPSRLITKFEYDYLTKNELTESEMLEISQINRREKLNFRIDGRGIKLSQYVGSMFLSSGTTIEVLPKVYSTDREEDRLKARKLLSAILYELFDLNRKGGYGGGIRASEEDFKMPLFEILVTQVLNYVEKRIVQPGIYKHYERQKLTSRSVSGKLLITQMVQKFPHLKDKVIIEKVILTANVPINRTVLNLAEFISKRCTNQKNKTLARKIVLYLKSVGIGSPQSVAKDLKRSTINRLNRHYYPVIQFAKSLFGNKKIISAKSHPFSFLFDMNKLFETFVAKSLPGSIYDNSKAETISEDFILRPDILLPTGDRELVVIDTKWKFPSGGIHQQDRFQVISYMYVMSERRNLEIPAGILLYPELPYNERKRVWKLSNRKKLIALSLNLRQFLQSERFVGSESLDETAALLKRRVRETVELVT